MDFASEHPVIPGYQLLEILGEGGTGVVYRAKGGLREVAIKILKPSLSRNGVSRERFLQEAALLARLDVEHGEHPHLVPVIDAGELGEHLCIITKLMRHGDLNGWLADHGIAGRVEDPEQFLSMAEQIADGVGYLHANGIVHADLKPGNLFVDLIAGASTIRIGDLGLASSTDLGESSSMGSPQFMAPELLAGGIPNPTTDVYAMGVTFFRMLTGTHPFQGSSLGKLVERVRGSIAPSVLGFNHRLSHVIGELVNRCLSRDPADRYVDAAALLAEIRHVRDGGKKLEHLPTRTQAQLLSYRGAVMQQKPQASAAPIISTGAPDFDTKRAPFLGYFLMLGPDLYRDPISGERQTVAEILQNKAWKHHFNESFQHSGRSVSAVTYVSRFDEMLRFDSEQAFFGSYHGAGGLASRMRSFFR